MHRHRRRPRIRRRRRSKSRRSRRRRSKSRRSTKSRGASSSSSVLVSLSSVPTTAPNTFVFDRNKFKCTLKRGQCKANNKDGTRCNRKGRHPVDYCRQHLAEVGLKIAESSLLVSKSTSSLSGTSSSFSPRSSTRTAIFRHQLKDMTSRSVKEKGKGYGLYTTRRIRFNEYLRDNRNQAIIYDGDVVTNKELVRRYGDDRITAPYVFRRLRVEKGMPKIYQYVDAACKRGVLSFMNTAGPEEENNMEFGPEGYAAATREIMPGEELLVSYGSAYKLEGPPHRTFYEV